MCLLVCWNVKAAVNWHHPQIFNRGLTLCEKATVWYLEGRGKKITFSVEAVWRIPAWGLRSHVWRMSGQRRSLLVSTRKVPSHDSDRQHLVRGTDGPLQGASRRRWRSLSFECRRLGERLLHVISSHTHTRRRKISARKRLRRHEQIEAVIETMATFEQRILFLFNPDNVVVSRAHLGRTCCSIRPSSATVSPALRGDGSQSQRSKVGGVRGRGTWVNIVRCCAEAVSCFI